MDTGMVLRIEKTSIHDGEGLRTVVFLKGCPLRCKWCSTPESQKMAVSCGYGKEMTVQEVVREVCKDEIFFFHSRGGVTISGGEVLLQADFAQKILKSCIEQGISTAIETSLYAPYEEIKKLLPYLTSMYIDYKMADEKRHKFYTGVSNQRIKENLIHINEEFKGDIHIRIPTIPTVNLFEKNMKETAEFLVKLKRVRDVELLPYHQLGLETYRKLGRIYEMKGIKAPSEQEMEDMAALLQNMLPECKIKIKGKLYKEQEEVR